MLYFEILFFCFLLSVQSNESGNELVEKNPIQLEQNVTKSNGICCEENLENNLDKESKSNEKILNQLNLTEKRFEQLNQIIQTLTTKVKTIEFEQNQTKSNHLKQIDRLEKAKTELNVKNQNFENVIFRLQKDLQQLRNNNGQLQTTNHSLQEKIFELMKEDSMLMLINNNGDLKNDQTRGNNLDSNKQQQQSSHQERLEQRRKLFSYRKRESFISDYLQSIVTENISNKSLNFQSQTSNSSKFSSNYQSMC